MPENAKPIFVEERKASILKILKKRKKLTVLELCNIFQVSGATIRNDLRVLQNSGTLTRTHGGAIERIQTGFELDSNQKQVQHLIEKQLIAKAALSLINDGDKLVIDTGTTTCELAKLLNQRSNLTVLTNDIVIARILEEFEGIELILLGGIVRKKFHCTVGLRGCEIFSGLIVDKAFMGVNSISFQKGATTPDLNQAETKKSMMKMANKTILLCNSSKIGNVSFAQFANLGDIDTIVTEHITEDFKGKFEESGIEIVLP